MSQSESKHLDERTVKSTSGTKKPYMKPEVRHERVFETMALSCGKVNTTQSSCRFNRRNS
jgi:hypothetical protein